MTFVKCARCGEEHAIGDLGHTCRTYEQLVARVTELEKELADVVTARMRSMDRELILEGRLARLSAPSASVGGVEAGVAQTAAEGPSNVDGNRGADRASGEEQRSCKPLVPGSIPGPSLDPTQRASEAAPDLDWITPDTLVEYQASKAQGRWYAAVVDGWPRSLGSSTVVRLREVEPAYSRDHHPGQNRTTIIAASVDCVRPRPNEARPECRCVKCHECFTGRHERCAYGCLTTEAPRPKEALHVLAPGEDPVVDERVAGAHGTDPRPPEAESETDPSGIPAPQACGRGPSERCAWRRPSECGTHASRLAGAPRTDHPRPISECPECHEDVGAGDPHVDMCSRPALAMWRVGRKLGRTIYWGDVLHGMVDLPEIAKRICDAMNAAESRPETPSRDAAGRTTVDIMAQWIVDSESHPTGGGDHACKRCYPETYIGTGKFVCGFHLAKDHVAAHEQDPPFVKPPDDQETDR